MRVHFPATLVVAAVALSSNQARADMAIAPPDNGSEAPREPAPKRHSKGMMIGGGVLIGLGVLSAGGSIPFFAESAGCRGDFCGFYTAFGAGLLLTGVVMLGIGIPLTIVGAAPANPGEATALPAPYAIHIGPGTTSLEWRF